MSINKLGKGIYGFGEAARLLRATLSPTANVNPRRLRSWFCGWGPYGQPVTQSDYESARNGSGIISFLDLVDALVIARLREERFSLQYIRKVRCALVDRLGDPHPFCLQNLLTDGTSIFVRFMEELHEERLMELVTRQYAFQEILEPYLRQIIYDPESFTAVRWNIGEGVVVDPRRHYGKPIVNTVGIPTIVLAKAYEANERDPWKVAEWYGVETEDIRVAVQFEETLSRAAA